ncbi:hypothetical protein [Curvibacter lanceolatus]|uniref:hypothetical protein n=1 Tax=Curvibacter lanceolatus TaxID=86182 RepID=UPI0003814052|nr:hypothetical protein [Curvibacter lanceolatus]
MTARNWQLSMPTQECYWIDKILFDVHHKEGHLQRYVEDPMTYMESFALSHSVKAQIRDNDIGALYLAGANPYLLRAHALGVHMLEQDFLLSLRSVNQKVAHG